MSNLLKHKHNFYDINSKVKNYEILEVGKAWVSCKNISPVNHEHDHDRDQDQCR